MTESETKRCPRCQRELPTAAFTKDRHRRDGLNAYCAQCNSEMGKIRRAADPSAFRAWAKKWRDANPEKQSEISRRYHAEHVEEIHIRKCRNYAENSASHRMKARHYRHLFRQGTKNTDLTIADLSELLAGRTMCPCCGKKMTDGPGVRQKNLDHIIPIAVGGTHTVANVRVICRACNLARPRDGSDLDGFQPALWSVAS